MKIKILLSCVALIAFGWLFLCAVNPSSFLHGFAWDIREHISHPEYYKWKSGKIPFDQSFFWPGFNTDKHKEEMFIGKTKEEITQMLPVVNKPEHLDPTHYLNIQYSLWMLQFDDSGHCIRLYLHKG